MVFENNPLLNSHQLGGEGFWRYNQFFCFGLVIQNTVVKHSSPKIGRGLERVDNNHPSKEITNNSIFYLLGEKKYSEISRSMPHHGVMVI